MLGATSPFEAGTGVSLSGHTPSWNASGRHGEFEWPLVIRRFADRAITSEDGDTFEFRMTDASGNAISRGATPSLKLEVPAFHLGGTFVETPGRIGPWQAANGDLYFIMEPTESDNLFMLVKSSDGGRSWHEVDGENRPATGDLESVDGQLVAGTIPLPFYLRMVGRIGVTSRLDASSNHRERVSARRALMYAERRLLRS